MGRPLPLFQHNRPNCGHSFQRVSHAFCASEPLAPAGQKSCGAPEAYGLWLPRLDAPNVGGGGADRGPAGGVLQFENHAHTLCELIEELASNRSG